MPITDNLVLPTSGRVSRGKGKPITTLFHLAGVEVLDIHSRRDPGVTYRTDLRGSTCTCPAGEHGKLCAHIKDGGDIYSAAMDGTLTPELWERVRALPLNDANDFFRSFYKLWDDLDNSTAAPTTPSEEGQDDFRDPFDR